MGNISHSKYWTVLLCPVSHTFIITNMLFGLIKVNLGKINNKTSYRPGWVQCKLFCTSVTWNGTKTKKKTVAALLFTPSIGNTIRKHFTVQITHIQIICLSVSHLDSKQHYQLIDSFMLLNTLQTCFYLQLTAFKNLFSSAFYSTI